MQHLFWLIEGELCGRSGPNHDPWSLTELAGAGVGAVLSVNEGESVYEDELAAAKLAYACVPLAANAPPRPGDLELCLERLPRALDFVNAQLERGAATLVHCRHGKDRTGLFMAYYLNQRHGLAPEAALARVRSVRPIALTATGWDAFALEVLTRA